MARQFFIPGHGALNEVGRRQYFVPGMGAANELGAANFSAAFAETLTAADSHAAGMMASASLADSAAASDSYIPALRYYAAFVPGFGAFREGPARQFFVPGRGAIHSTGRAKVIPPVTVAASYATSEASATSDNLASTGAFRSATSDYAFASDLPPAVPIFSATYGDITPGDTQYGSVGILPAAARSGGASSVYSEIVLGDTQYAGDGGATFNPSFTAPYVMVRYGAPLAEPLAVADLLSAVAAFGDMVSEQASATDGTTSFFPDQEPLNEPLVTADDVAAVGRFILQLSEAIMASDRMDGYIDIPTPLQRIIIADDD